MTDEKKIEEMINTHIHYLMPCLAEDSKGIKPVLLKEINNIIETAKRSIAEEILDTIAKYAIWDSDYTEPTITGYMVSWAKLKELRLKYLGE